MKLGWILRVFGFGVLAAAVALGVLLAALGEDVRHVVFAHPLWLLLGVVPLAALIVRSFTAPRPATMRFSRKRSLERVGGGFAVHLAELPDGLRFAAALLLVLTCARPQSTRMTERVEHEGIDIVIALDLSDSMSNPMDGRRGLGLDRLTVAKQVIDEFIRRRPHDRIALVGFGAHASTIAPLTLDHAVLRNLIVQVRLGVVDGQETAIGAGLGVSLNRLKESQAATKIIVLLTDGVHNADGMDPDTVAQTAAERGVVIYTVLMGQQTGDRSSVDAGQLERLAGATDGYAYLAEDTQTLETSFQDLLDKLEKSSIEGEQIRAELFYWLLWPVILLLLLDVTLRNTRLRRFP
ncbi:aerotolerance-related membrane protein [Plesiocystis pacifica SIR-1]|uniref:Aerotolerance-related membrane protein n=1 Tax=Plesiocystis pacifica SIR-1 TaxID=391625 RepID=A6G2R7_9BACT|nr:VWA domain-containing protein [Plesiocystis pacifica]EDM79767.1 aerotolerance-related membrane protein [Plesiocystis pacifica SIR-1]